MIDCFTASWLDIKNRCSFGAASVLTVTDRQTAALSGAFALSSGVLGLRSTFLLALAAWQAATLFVWLSAAACVIFEGFSPACSPGLTVMQSVGVMKSAAPGRKKTHIPLSAQVKSAASPNNHPSRRLAFRVLWFNPNQRTFSLGVDLLDMTLRIKFFLKLAFYAHKRVICVHKMIFFGCKLVICLHKLAFLGTKWQ